MEPLYAHCTVLSQVASRTDHIIGFPRDPYSSCFHEQAGQPKYLSLGLHVAELKESLFKI
jgi:hypothetical protein